MIIFDEKRVKKVAQKELEIAEPKYTCRTCGRCTATSNCSFFHRHVDKDYNRCFNHTGYASPTIKAEFKPLPSEIMDRILKENAEVA